MVLFQCWAGSADDDINSFFVGGKIFSWQLQRVTMGDLLVWALKLDPSLHQDTIGKISSRAFDWCNKNVVFRSNVKIYLINFQSTKCTTVSSLIDLREKSRFSPFFYSYSKPLQEGRCFPDFPLKSIVEIQEQPLLRPDFFGHFSNQDILEFDPFECAKQCISSKEYPRNITLSSQIQKLMKLWAVIDNGRISTLGK